MGTKNKLIVLQQNLKKIESKSALNEIEHQIIAQNEKNENLMAEIERISHCNLEQMEKLKALRKEIETLNEQKKIHQLGLCVVDRLDLTNNQSSEHTENDNDEDRFNPFQSDPNRSYIYYEDAFINKPRNVTNEGITDNETLRQIVEKNQNIPSLEYGSQEIVES